MNNVSKWTISVKISTNVIEFWLAILAVLGDLAVLRNETMI